MKRENFDKAIRNKLLSFQDKEASSEDIRKVMMAINKPSYNIWQITKYGVYLAGLIIVVLGFYLNKYQSISQNILTKSQQETIKKSLSPIADAEMTNKPAYHNSQMVKQNDLAGSTTSNDARILTQDPQNNRWDNQNGTNPQNKSISNYTKDMNMESAQLFKNRKQDQRIIQSVPKLENGIFSARDISLSDGESKVNTINKVENTENHEMSDDIFIHTKLENLGIEANTTDVAADKINRPTDQIKYLTQENLPLTSNHVTNINVPVFTNPLKEINKTFRIGISTHLTHDAIGGGLLSEYFVSDRWSLMSGIQISVEQHSRYRNENDFRDQKNSKFTDVYDLKPDVQIDNIVIKPWKVLVPLQVRYYHPLAYGWSGTAGIGVSMEWLEVHRFSYLESNVNNKSNKTFNKSFSPFLKLDAGVEKSLGRYAIQLTASYTSDDKHVRSRSQDIGKDLGFDVRLFRTF
jgi:hypothetical protein